MSQKFGSWALFILLSIVWGSAFIVIKTSAEELNGWQIGAVRIASAGLVFLPFALFHLRHIPLRKLPLVILSGALGNLFPAFLFAIAIEKKINSSLAGILNSLTPLFVIVIAVLFFRSKIAGRKIAGVLIGFIGLLILSLSKGGVEVDNFWFAMMILLATLMYGLNVNLVSYYLKDIRPMHLATVSLAFVALPAAVVVWQDDTLAKAAFDENMQLSIAAAALLGIVGSAIATALFYLLIQKAGGLFASLVTYGIPVVAIFWGVLAGEQVTLIQVACLALILGGVYLANKN